MALHRTAHSGEGKELMPRGVDPEEFGMRRWLAVYGAMVAAQAREWVLAGRGGVTPEAMVRFREEAEAVANLEEESHAER
jgi:hypothetical protein